LWQVKPAWSYFTAVEFVLASSMVFELAEWLGAVTLAPDFADSYLGQQGDAWDAHKDMGLAAMGAVTSVLVAALLRYAKGGSDSLAVEMRECERSLSSLHVNASRTQPPESRASR
jgi:hypothetical protein